MELKENYANNVARESRRRRFLDVSKGPAEPVRLSVDSVCEAEKQRFLDFGDIGRAREEASSSSNSNSNADATARVHGGGVGGGFQLQTTSFSKTGVCLSSHSTRFEMSF